MKKIGRPALPKGSARDCVLIVRLLPAEEEEIEKAAKHAEKTKSDFVREAALAAAKGPAMANPDIPSIVHHYDETFLD